MNKPKDDKCLTIEEALALVDEISADLQRRRQAARKAEAEYWSFLDEDDDNCEVKQ